MDLRLRFYKIQTDNDLEFANRLGRRMIKDKFDKLAFSGMENKRAPI